MEWARNRSRLSLGASPIKAADLSEGRAKRLTAPVHVPPAASGHGGAPEPSAGKSGTTGTGRDRYLRSQIRRKSPTSKRACRLLTEQFRCYLIAFAWSGDRRDQAALFSRTVWQKPEVQQHEFQAGRRAVCIIPLLQASAFWGLQCHLSA
jgi:hypothetical protein